MKLSSKKDLSSPVLFVEDALTKTVIEAFCMNVIKIVVTKCGCQSLRGCSML
jgi:hypothetical protein